MVLPNIFNIIGSTLTAQSQRLDVTTNNLMNVNSMTDPDGQPYQAK